MKQDLAGYMHMKLAEWKKDNNNAGLTGSELDKLMEKWANEYYNDGSKVTIVGNFYKIER